MAGTMQVGLVTLGVVESPPRRLLLLERGESEGESLNKRKRESTAGAGAASASENSGVVMIEDVSADRSSRDRSHSAVGDADADADTTASFIPNNRNILHTKSAIAVPLNRPTGFRDGVRLGFVGAITEPLTGFMTDDNSLRGLLVGSAKGALGLIARPLYGLLGSWARKLEYVSYAVLPRIDIAEKHRMKRARSPRHFEHGPNMPLEVYRVGEFMGLELLSRINAGRYRNEGYLWHCRLKDDTVAVLTPIRLMVASTNASNSDYPADDGGDDCDCELLWQCLLSQILFLEIDLDQSATQPTTHESAQSLVGDSNLVHGSLSNSTPAAFSYMTRRRQFTAEEAKKRLRSLRGAPLLHVYHLPSKSQPQLVTASPR
jgi:hypothetical protein